MAGNVKPLELSADAMRPVVQRWRYEKLHLIAVWLIAVWRVSVASDSSPSFRVNPASAMVLYKGAQTHAADRAGVSWPVNLSPSILTLTREPEREASKRMHADSSQDLAEVQSHVRMNGLRVRVWITPAARTAD